MEGWYHNLFILRMSEHAQNKKVVVNFNKILFIKINKINKILKSESTSGNNPC